MYFHLVILTGPQIGWSTVSINAERNVKRMLTSEKLFATLEFFISTGLFLALGIPYGI